MKKNLNWLILFIVSLSASILFQNCGESSIKANSSGDNGGLEVEVVPEVNNDSDGENDNSGDGGDGGSSPQPNPFFYDLGQGDFLIYKSGGDFSPNLSTSKLQAKQFSILMESTIFHSALDPLAQDLSTGYCDSSALPHCRHLNGTSCVGSACPVPGQSVRCHWEKPLNTADINTTFGGINNLLFFTRQVTPENPMIADCDSPNIFFYRDNQETKASLAGEQCAPDQGFYAGEGDDLVKAIFDSEFSRIDNLDDQCNNYATYTYLTTKWSYRSNNGFTTQLNHQFREVSYDVIEEELDGVMQTRGIVSLRWKDSGDTQTLCAEDVFINEYDEFFPPGGLKYSINYFGAILADGPVAHITYEDPIDGGNTWQFHMNSGSAQSQGGAAVLDSAQATIIQDAVEVLINRAKTLTLGSACP